MFQRIFYFCVLASIWVCGCQTSAKIDTSTLTLETLEGSSVKLNAYAGKTMVIHYWATWCKDCWREMPSLIETYQSLSEEEKSKVVFVFISDESPERIQSYTASHPLPFVILRTEQSFRDLGISFIPQTFILNARGEQVANFGDSHTWSKSDVVKWL
jgi:thiol-disulfide isomerase/thioredoxin